MTSPITIRPATADDAAAIAQVHYDAQAQFNDFYGAFFAVHPRDGLIQSTKRGLARLSEPGNKTSYLVAEDDTASGKVVGFAWYAVVEPAATDTIEAQKEDSQKQPEPRQENDIKKEEEAGATQTPSPSIWAPKEHLKDLWDRFGKVDDEKDACEEKAVGDKRHIKVFLIMVDPSHQRRGIGGKLLDKVLARCDREALPSYIMSSREAYELYRRHGFEKLASWEVDNGYWMGELVAREKELGRGEEFVKAAEELARRYQGKTEVESAMMRMPRERV